MSGTRAALPWLPSTEAIRLNPDYARAYFMRGNLWLARGDNDRAISDFSVALGLDPNNTDAYVNRGVAWYAEDDNDRAIADYDTGDPSQSAGRRRL